MHLPTFFYHWTKTKIQVTIPIVLKTYTLIFWLHQHLFCLKVQSYTFTCHNEC